MSYRSESQRATEEDYFSPRTERTTIYTGLKTSKSAKSQGLRGPERLYAHCTVSVVNELTIYFKGYCSGAKCCLPRSSVCFQPSPILFICVFPYLSLLVSLPCLSWCRILDKLEYCVIHSKDCLHWYILVLRRTFVPGFLSIH